MRAPGALPTGGRRETGGGKDAGSRFSGEPERDGVPSALDGMTVLSVYDVSLTVDGSSVHELGGTATLTVPVQLGSGQSSENLKAYYVADDGIMTLIDGSYDSATKTLSIQTGHFSVFAVVYEEPSSSDDGDSTLLYVAIAVVAIVVVIAAAALYMRSRAGKA